MKQLFTFILILHCVFVGLIMNGITIDLSRCQPPVEQNTDAFFIRHDDTSNVFIPLNTNGMSYGHELLWKANTTGTNYEESAVVYCDGMAYIGSCSTHGDGYDSIFAVDTTDGSILWSVPIGPGYVGPVIDHDRIYIGTSSHGNDPTNEYVYCINRSDGKVLWLRNIYGGIAESILYDNNNIYFASDLIYALNKSDGALRWTYPLDDYSVTKPILKNNAFFTATSGGTMYKVNVLDGSRLWEVYLPDFSWDNSITADGDGHIFIAVYHDGSINAYMEDTGSLLWSYQLHARSLSFNAYHNHVIFIADTSGYVYALDASSGILLWETKIGGICDISSPSISGGLLFIGTRDFEEGALFALNETTGNIVWTYPIEASVTAPPSIADGMLFCGTDDWNMFAFDVGIGDGDWLLHRYDTCNTAFSSTGLTTWQYVSASCHTVEDITTCTIQNTYDHTVFDVTLTLSDGISANWYNATGHLLKSDSAKYVLEAVSSQSTLTLIISNVNIHRPSKPILVGPSSGRSGKDYRYMVSATDPTGVPLSYFIDWGDGSNTGWITQPYGDTLNVPHSWNEKGAYLIQAKAKNIQGIESEWSDPIEVSMPKSDTYKHLTPLILKMMERFPLLRSFLVYSYS